MEIKAGNYFTRDGKRASVWELDKVNQEHWNGTVEGRGLNSWDKEGRDLHGTSEWDLVSIVETARDRGISTTNKMNSNQTMQY